MSTNSLNIAFYDFKTIFVDTPARLRNRSIDGKKIYFCRHNMTKKILYFNSLKIHDTLLMSTHELRQKNYFENLT